jgi:hypothetical protein
LGKDITYCYNSPRSLVSADFDVFELIAQTHGKAPLVIFTDNDSVLREYVGTVSAATGALPNSDEQDGWPRFVVPVTLTYDIYDQYVRSRGLSVNQLYYALTRTRDIERVGGGRTDMELFEDFVTIRHWRKANPTMSCLPGSPGVTSCAQYEEACFFMADRRQLYLPNSLSSLYWYKSPTHKRDITCM